MVSAAFWKVAAEELDYRRFFNINELISLRVEEEKVFRHTQALAIRLAREGQFTGLRIDHVDGLYDPLRYLRDCAVKRRCLLDRREDFGLRRRIAGAMADRGDYRI